MTPYEERLADDMHTSIREALRILERDIGRAGKPVPTLHQVATIRSQLAQACAASNELFGAMSVNNR